jgi:hypothetical protein
LEFLVFSQTHATAHPHSYFLGPVHPFSPFPSSHFISQTSRRCFFGCFTSDAMAPRSFKNMVIAISGTFPGYKQGKEDSELIANTGENRPHAKVEMRLTRVLFFSLQPRSRISWRSRVPRLALRLRISVPIWLLLRRMLRRRVPNVRINQPIPMLLSIIVVNLMLTN